MPPGRLGLVFYQWGGVVIGILLGILLAAGVFSVLSSVLIGRHGLRQRVRRRVFSGTAGIAVVGLLLWCARAVGWQIPALRFLMAIHALAMIGALFFLWNWLQRRYPVLLAAYELEERRRAFLPKAVGGQVESTRRKSGKAR